TFHVFLEGLGLGMLERPKSASETSRSRHTSIPRSNFMLRRPCPRKGSHWIELAIVIAILAMAAGLFLPATRRARDAGTRISCSNKIRQIALGYHNCMTTNEPKFPPSAITGNVPGTVPMGPFTPLLSYLEGDDLYARYNPKAPPADPSNADAVARQFQ